MMMISIRCLKRLCKYGIMPVWGGINQGVQSWTAPITNFSGWSNGSVVTDPRVRALACPSPVSGWHAHIGRPAQNEKRSGTRCWCDGEMRRGLHAISRTVHSAIDAPSPVNAISTSPIAMIIVPTQVPKFTSESTKKASETSPKFWE